MQYSTGATNDPSPTSLACVPRLLPVHNPGFMPLDPMTMSTTESKHVVESLIFLTEKKDGLIKGRHCANVNPQHQWMDQEQVSKESKMTTSIFEEKDNRDVIKWEIQIHTSKKT